LHLRATPSHRLHSGAAFTVEFGHAQASRPRGRFWGIINLGAIKLRAACGARSMSRTVQAVYENGAFRPLEPVSCQEQERVVLTVENAAAVEENVLDQEFIAYCETQADDSVSLEAVRQALAKIPGSLADDIRAERDED